MVLCSIIYNLAHIRSRYALVEMPNVHKCLEYLTFDPALSIPCGCGRVSLSPRRAPAVVNDEEDKSDNTKATHEGKRPPNAHSVYQVLQERDCDCRQSTPDNIAGSLSSGGRSMVFIHQQRVVDLEGHLFRVLPKTGF